MPLPERKRTLSMGRLKTHLFKGFAHGALCALKGLDEELAFETQFADWKNNVANKDGVDQALRDVFDHLGKAIGHVECAIGCLTTLSDHFKKDS